MTPSTVTHTHALTANGELTGFTFPNQRAAERRVATFSKQAPAGFEPDTIFGVRQIDPVIRNTVLL